jgi:hypothetical protein
VSKPRPSSPDVIAAMELLLTKRQIEAVKEITAGGSGKLQAIRELVSHGIAARESEQRAFNQKVVTILKADLDLRSALGDSIVFRARSGDAVSNV